MSSACFPRIGPGVVISALAHRIELRLDLLDTRYHRLQSFVGLYFALTHPLDKPTPVVPVQQRMNVAHNPKSP